jgi:hypothetical protein
MLTQDWGSVITNSLQNIWVGFVNGTVTVVGAILVFIVGLIVASLLGSLVEKIVQLIKLDKLLENLGVGEYVERAGLTLNSGKFFKKLVYWLLVIVFLLAASDILGFYSLSSFLNSVLLYVPNVIVAVLIMLAAFVVAHFLRGLVIASVKASKLHGAGFLGSLTWWSITIFGFLAALSQLGIAVTIVNILVTGVIAMLALAFGLAFGLGGKEYAAHLIGKLREQLEK